jgi:hypothetical protein
VEPRDGEKSALFSARGQPAISGSANVDTDRGQRGPREGESGRRPKIVGQRACERVKRFVEESERKVPSTSWLRTIPATAQRWSVPLLQVVCRRHFHGGVTSGSVPFSGRL